MKTSNFLYVFLTREMLVQLVNFEKCHSPLRSWLSPTGTVSGILYTACCYSNFFSGSCQESHGQRCVGTMHTDADAAFCLQPARINEI
jgi:hypothetical protein